MAGKRHHFFPTIKDSLPLSVDFQSKNTMLKIAETKVPGRKTMERKAIVIMEELSRWVITEISEVTLAIPRFVRLSDCVETLKNRLIRIPVRSV